MPLQSLIDTDVYVKLTTTTPSGALRCIVDLGVWLSPWILWWTSLGPAKTCILRGTQWTYAIKTWGLWNGGLVRGTDGTVRGTDGPVRGTEGL